MHSSALQLEHYELASLQISPVEDFDGDFEGKYPSFDTAQFESSVDFGLAKSADDPSESLWGLKLRLKCAPKEGLAFPYIFDVSIVGFLSGAKLPDEKRQDLVLVNGTSLLYGALRDEVLRLTSRMRHGPLLLPTAQFHSLANTHGSGKAPSKKIESEGAPKKRLKSEAAK
jgi:preprotein translocase subunit SecB